MTGAEPTCRRPAATDRPLRVLALHGLGGQAAAWREFATHCPEWMELWDVDLPWRGRSGGTWSHGRDQLDAVVRVVARSAVDFDAVVAHSYSAMLLLEALEAGLVNPRAAVLMCPFYRSRPEDFDWPAITYYLTEFHRTFREALELGPTRRFPDRHRSWMATALRDDVGPYGWTRWFESYLRTPFLDLSAVDTPVRVVSAEADIAARPEDGRALAAALPAATFTELPGCGHFPMLQQPRAAATAVAGFLSEFMSPPRTDVRPGQTIRS